MKLLLCLVASASLLPALLIPSQAQSAKPTATSKPSTEALPPFAGRWVLNSERSKLLERIRGLNTAVILYDGKTWTYIHRHQDSPDDEPEAWQATLTVNSPVMHTAVSSGDITFRSRIQRVGNAMLLTEVGTTLNHQRINTTIRYTLEDGGNTLVETETSVGPLGPQKNIYVLDRENSKTMTSPANN